MTSSINAGVNQTFSVTLSVAMIHLVVNEALLFNIFTIPGPWTTEIIILFSVLLLSLDAHNHVDDYSGTLRGDRTKKERKKKKKRKRKRRRRKKKEKKSPHFSSGHY